MRDDDLTDLLTPKPDDGFGFRQGRLLTYTPLTGANTVLVGGGVLTNLPVVIEGGPANLQGDDVLGPGLGNVVIIMKMKSAWAILGRVLIPGSPDVISSNDIIQGTRVPNPAFTFPATPANAVTITAVTPSWANKVVVQSTFVCTVSASVAGQPQIGIQILSGATLLATTPFPNALGILDIPAGKTGTITVSDAANLPVVPGGTLTINGVVGAAAAFANTSNAWLIVTVTYQKI